MDIIKVWRWHAVLVAAMLCFAGLAAPSFFASISAIRALTSGEHSAHAGMIVMPNTHLCFSPEGHCEDLIVREIGAAEHQILVHAFSFTSTTNIPAALVAAKDRGVEVKVIIDRRTPCGHSAVPELMVAKVDIAVDKSPPYAHEKAIIIDGYTVVSGSYNWSREARYNSEDLRIDRDADQAAQYTRHWQSRAAKSVPYLPETGSAWCHGQAAGTVQ